MPIRCWLLRLRKSVGARVLMVVVLCAAPSSAEITRPVGISCSLGYSNPGRPGLGMNASAYARAWVLALYLTADVTAELAGRPRETWNSGSGSSNYRSETFSNGQTVCRELSTGEFTEKYNCDGGSSGNSLIAGMAELHLSPLSVPFFVGAGMRTSPAPGPFAVIGYLNQSAAVFQFWFLRSALGSNFLQIHAGLSL
jgi:hypothetical protein